MRNSKFQSKHKNKINKKTRFLILFLTFIGLWIFIILRASYLQILPQERLKALESKQFKTHLTLRSRRGDVIDRYGMELASTIPAYSLFVDPKLIKRPRALSRKLAKVIGGSSRKIYTKLVAKDRRFMWLKRQLPQKKKKIIQSWKLRSLGFVEEPQRVYPNNRLLSQVLGFVGLDDRGLEGLELSHNGHLNGLSRKLKLQRDARGRPLLLNGRVFMDLPDGLDLILTIDGRLQFFLEKELKQAIKKFKADSAVGVILDAQTSEILAMANGPGYNINKHYRFPSKNFRNRAITDAFEPGSTMKTFVAAAALKVGVAQPNTKFDCGNGRLKIGRRVIKEADSRHNYKKLSLSDIIAKSSNVGITNVGFKVGAKRLRETLKEFGFGHKTGVELPGEGGGQLHSLPWGKHQLSNISFGHAMTATPLQIANAYAVIANGGLLRKPYILFKKQGEDENEKRKREDNVVRRVLTVSQAEALKLILLSATGSTARIPGYLVAGKTGTAQMAKTNGRGYEKGAYISSFAGFVPQSNPKYVIYIAVNHPRTEYYGAKVAAPIFAKVAQFAVRRSGLVPSVISQGDLLVSEKEMFRFNMNTRPKASVANLLESSFLKATNVSEPNQTPDLLGDSLREAIRKVSGSEIQFKVHGSGRVSLSYPMPGKKLPKSKLIHLYLKDQIL